MAEDKKLHEEEVAKAKAFILANSKQNDKGTSRSMNASAYVTYFADERMITADQLKAVVAGDKCLLSASIAVAADDLAKLIPIAKANGEDPRELEVDLRISRPSGPLTVEVKAQQVSQRPVRPGEEVGPDGPEKIIKYGYVNAKVRLKSMIDPDAAATCAAFIGEMLATS